MKLLDTFIFSFAILFMLIAIHQAMNVGYANSYWLFMLAFAFLMWYQVRKKGQKKEAEAGKKPAEPSSKKRKYKM